MRKFIVLITVFFVSQISSYDFINESSSLIHELIETNYRKSQHLKVLRLFEVENQFFKALQNEVVDLVKNFAPSKVAQKSHVTNWTKPFGYAAQYSLLNSSGDFNDFSVDHIKSIQNKKFHYQQRYPAISQFIQLFPHATNFRINVMGPNSGLSQHKESLVLIHSKTNKPALRVRFHLPIITNDTVEMLVEGSIFKFKEGEIYFFHNGGVHAAKNCSLTHSRIHFVWDMLLTQETFLRMFKRSVEIDLLLPCLDVTVPTVKNVVIDKNFPVNRGKERVPYSEAKKIQLCPVQ